MVKIFALQGISNTFKKQGSYGSPRKRPHKREHAWVDVSDDDLEVRSAKKQAAFSKATHNPNHGHGPRKKPRMSAPASFPSKEPIQMQRQQLPIYAGA